MATAHRRRSTYGPHATDSGPYERYGAPKWDPLAYGRLPPHETQLDYRPRHATEPVLTAALLLGASVLSTGAVYAAQLLGWTATGAVYAPLWLGAIVFGTLYYVARYRDLRRAGTFLLKSSALFGAVYALRLTVLGFVPAWWFLFAFSLVGLAIVLDGAATNGLEWEAAAPTVPKDLREKIARAWRHRFNRSASDLADRDLDKAIRRHRARLVAALAVSAIPLAPSFQLAPIVLAPLLVLVLATSSSGRHYLGASLHGLQLYLHYGEQGQGAPGVLHTRAGALFRRRALTAGTISLLAAALTAPLGLPYLRYLYYRYPQDAPEFIITLGGTFFVPLATCALAFLLGPGPLFSALRRFSVRQTPETTNEWDTYVERIQTSNDPVESKQLLLGFHATADYPVYLPLEILEGHAHILGASRSGKTARAINPILTQLIRRGTHHPTERSPIVVIDLKGDLALFQSVRLEAERAKRDFRYFTNLSGRSTHAFNPLGDLKARDLTLAQVCQVLLNALNLDHGWGYGKGFFSALGRDWLARMLELPEAPATFARLADLASDRSITTRDEEREAFEVIAAIRSLAAVSALAFDSALALGPEVREAAIHIPTALEEDHVLYFWLDPAIEEATARQIAGLALYSLYTACKERSDRGQWKRTYLVIDEFQSVAGRNFTQVIQKAGGAGLSLILCNQEREALKVEPGTDLFKVLEESTAYRQFFTARSPELRRYLEDLSGESLYLQWSYSDSSGPHGDTSTVSSTEQLAPRLTPNDIIELSSNAEVSFIHQPVPAGFSQFRGYLTAITSPFHVSPEEHEARMRTPWPALSARTMQNPSRTESANAASPSQNGHRLAKRTSPPVQTDTKLAARYAALTLKRD